MSPLRPRKTFIQFVSTLATFATASSFASSVALRGSPRSSLAHSSLFSRRIPAAGKPTAFSSWTANMASAQNILCGLDGEPIGYTTFSEALARVEGSTSSEVTGVEIITENFFPTSQTAVLKLQCGDAGEKKLFVKKVSALAMAHKPWTDRRRTLAYSRTEMRFYNEFAQVGSHSAASDQDMLSSVHKSNAGRQKDRQTDRQHRDIDRGRQKKMRETREIESEKRQQRLRGSDRQHGGAALRELSARGVSLPRCAATIDAVDALLGDTAVADPAGDEP
eukprot:3503205-Rhodomonas_salina.1